MLTTRPSLFLIAVSGALGILAAPRDALAGPTVGVVVLSHVGLTEDQADEIAAEIAAAVQRRIQGTTKHGAPVRELLPPGGPEEGCEQQPECGRALAKTLASDETLLLVAHKQGHRPITLQLHRVPRDPARSVSHAALHVLGAPAKRFRAIDSSVANLFPVGSAVAFVEPAPAVPAKTQKAAPANGTHEEDDTDEVAAAPVTVDEPAPVKDEGRRAVTARKAGGRPSRAVVADESDVAAAKPVYKKGWFIGVMTAVGAVVVAGVVVGVVLGIPPSPTAAAVTLP